MCFFTLDITWILVQFVQALTTSIAGWMFHTWLFGWHQNEGLSRPELLFISNQNVFILSVIWYGWSFSPLCNLISDHASFILLPSYFFFLSLSSLHRVPSPTSAWVYCSHVTAPRRVRPSLLLVFITVWHRWPSPDVVSISLTNLMHQSHTVDMQV